MPTYQLEDGSGYVTDVEVIDDPNNELEFNVNNMIEPALGDDIEIGGAKSQGQKIVINKAKVSKDEVRQMFDSDIVELIEEEFDE